MQTGIVSSRRFLDNIPRLDHLHLQIIVSAKNDQLKFGQA